MSAPRVLTPFTLPILFFGLAILAGGAALHAEACVVEPLSWLDALFTATSAVCVTGLVVVDTGSHFTPLGQGVILTLIQLGGLGVMTYTSLAFYLWRRKVSLTDRLAVGQSLLVDPSFHLGRFLIHVFTFTLVAEFVGALFLFLLDPAGFHPGSAVFHSISAFCNAGFALQADSLMGWSGHVGVNLVFIALIVGGGLGFAVWAELAGMLLYRIKGVRAIPATLHLRTVLTTTALLVLLGGLILFLAEYFGQGARHWRLEMLVGLFQSVTCRTAGFNTVDIGTMTNVSLVFMMLLMFIGGSPGSTAGGIKTTTFRVVLAFLVSQVKGRTQTVVHHRAVDKETLNRALILCLFAGVTVFTATLLLSVTEGGDVPHTQVRGQFLELMFEAMSAFGTTGLSTGVTPDLSAAGKSVVMVLMFLGRLGPILFLTVLSGMQHPLRYEWAEDRVMIG